MLSPQGYAIVGSINLHEYYNVPLHLPLICGLCPSEREATLKAYRQHDGRTYWYVCRDCGFAGTGLDYLAACEKEHPLRVLRKLKHDGTCRSLDEETIRSYGEWSKAARSLRIAYRGCRRFERTGSVPLTPLENLDDYFQVTRYRMEERKTFEKLFHPGTHCAGASGSRLFHGKRWGRITAIPLYDLPQRMSGILFVNGCERSIVIKRLGPRRTNEYAFEPGYLASTEIVPNASEPVILCTDWFRVLRLQADIWFQERNIAPIVGWFPSHPLTGKPWQYHFTVFRDIPKIFWAAPNDIVSLREACINDGLISYAYYKPETNACVLPPLLSAGAVLRSVIKDTIPWHKALTWHLGTDPSQAESRLSALQLPRRTLERFLHDAPASLRKIVAVRFESSLSTHRYVDGLVIAETPEGWFRIASHAQIPPALLSSARCIVDRVVRFANKEPMYQGRVLIRDESFPFLVSESEIERNPVRFIRQVCAEARSRVLPIINVPPEKMMKLIRAHGTFDVVHVPTGFGWSDETASLSLPNLTFSDNAIIESEWNLEHGPLVSLRYKHCESLTPTDLQILVSFQDETPYILAMMVALLPGLFAPAYTAEMPQTAVIAANIELLQRIFEMLRLPVFLKGVPRSLMDYTETHRCPFLVRLGLTSTKRVDRLTWADLPGFHNGGFVAAPLTAVLARMCYGNANMLTLPKKRFYRWLHGKLPDVYLKCFTALLKHCSRYVLEPRDSDNWNGDLIREAYRFLETELGLPVHKKTLFDGDSPSSFCDYVTLLSKKDDLVIVYSERGLEVSAASLGDCFRKHVGMFDFDRIREMLTKTALLRKYDPVKHIFILDPEPFQASAKRLDRSYGHAVRK
jgi:hypothetical protein